MVKLEEIKKYCEGRKIIIVGNSSRILNGKHQKLIDSYEIVIRINSERLDYSNVYDVDVETYNILKQELGGFKPSTGISTYNFFNRFINFSRLDLIGFDFFESSSRQRNQLGHCYVEDHHGIKEKLFFEKSKDSDKTILHPIEGPDTVTINNIPVYNNYHIKNIKGR